MKYFTYREFERSVTADNLRINNTIPDNLRGNIEALVDNILDPLREAWGRPITVNSGYRSPSLNKVVGGVATSTHQSGQAADITTGNIADNRRLYKLVQSLKLPYFELIGTKYDFKWLHLSYAPEREQRQPS